MRKTIQGKCVETLHRAVPKAGADPKLAQKYPLRSIGVQDGLHNIEQGRGAKTDFRYHCPGLWHEASQSVRSAVIGSSRDARLAGSQEANAATAMRIADIPAKVGGSYGVMPYRSALIR